jgi:hypothetical protein
MRHFLILASLVFVGSVWAEDFNFNSPRAKAAMEKYQYDKKDLLRDLEAALEYERTEGRLEEAIKIRDAIATLNQQPDAPVSNSQMATETPLLVGVWKDVAQDAVWIVRPDGTAYSDVRKNGRWRMANTNGDDFTLKWQDGIVDNVTVNRDQESLEGFYAPSNWRWKMVRDSYPSRNQDSPAVSTQREKKIPADAVKYKGNYYLAVPMNRTHGGAMDYCKRLGGHLVRINKASEQAFVTRLARGSGLPKCWIDGSDAYKENEWLFSDGIRMSFFPWAPGQPDHSGNIEHNLVMFASDGYKWHDDAEYHSDRGFICEWEGGSSVPDTPTKPERTKPKPEEPIKKLSPQHAKRVLDDANLWEGKPGVWFLKQANNFSGRTYERLSQSNRIRSALASVNGRLPTPDEMNNPPSRR